MGKPLALALRGKFQRPKSAWTIASITIDRSGTNGRTGRATGADDSVSRSFARRDLIEKSICAVADFESRIDADAYALEREPARRRVSTPWPTDYTGL